MASTVFGLTSHCIFLKTQAGVCMHASHHNYYKVIYTPQKDYMTTILTLLWITNTPLNGGTSLFNQSLTGGQFVCFQSFTFFIFWCCQLLLNRLPEVELLHQKGSVWGCVTWLSYWRQGHVPTALPTEHVVKLLASCQSVGETWISFLVLSSKLEVGDLLF